ncbi:MAG: hypothetical protein NTU45_01650 [Planctomycetota bacterium]|nr:hypothetical protein [Planctomycetota bacterium]
MTAAANRSANGQIYIGLDFGMALTKVAVWAKLAQERDPTRFVIEFPRDNDPANPADKNRAVHVPSALWVGNGKIYGIPTNGTRRLNRIDGIKKMMLDSWNGAATLGAPTIHTLGGLSGWNAEKLAILKLAFVLRYVDMKLEQLSARTRVGARWSKLINAAIPPEEGEFQVSSPRTKRMRSVLERAWSLIPKIGSAEQGLALADALKLVDSVYCNPLTADSQTPVEVIPEALAAACFKITSDDAKPGNWLTVDVGALTTDTSYFFFNPDPVFQIACYSTLQSKQVGTEGLVRAGHIVEIKGRGYLPHEAIAQETTLATTHENYDCVVQGVLGAVKCAVKGAIIHHGSKVASVIADGRPQFNIMLVGGGSVNKAISPKIHGWTFPGLGPVECAVCSTAQLPRVVKLLSAESLLREGAIPPNDHAILTIAVGLAQPRIDLPRWCTSAPTPKWKVKEPPDNPYVGHN